MAGAVYLFVAHDRESLIDSYGIDGVAPLLAIGVASALVCLICASERGFAAYGLLLSRAAGHQLVVNPTINAARSGERFVRRGDDAGPRAGTRSCRLQRTIPAAAATAYHQLWSRTLA